MTYYLPIALVVVSNIVYHICAKSSPAGMSPFASLTVTYVVGAIVSAALMLFTSPNPAQEYAKLNWAPFVLGVAIVGLEAGFIAAYKAGWAVGSAALTQSAVLAVALVAVGALLYGEPITLKKVAGVAICIGGLFLLNG